MDVTDRVAGSSGGDCDCRDDAPADGRRDDDEGAVGVAVVLVAAAAAVAATVVVAVMAAAAAAGGGDDAWWEDWGAVTRLGDLTPAAEVDGAAPPAVRGVTNAAVAAVVGVVDAAAVGVGTCFSDAGGAVARSMRRLWFDGDAPVDAPDGEISVADDGAKEPRENTDTAAATAPKLGAASPATRRCD